MTSRTSPTSGNRRGIAAITVARLVPFVASSVRPPHVLAAGATSFGGGHGVIKGCVPKKGGALEVLNPGKKCLRGTVALPFGAMATAARRSLAVSARTRTVRANRHVIGYRSFGRGSNMVLVQGYCGTIDNWDPSFLDLLARSHRVAAFDNRRIGRSSGTVKGLSITEMADDLAGLIRALDLGRPTVLGLSMGGVIAQQFAIDHPKSASRLVLVSTSPGGHKSVPSPVDARTVPPFAWSKNLDLFFSTANAGVAYVRGINRRPSLERVPLAVAVAQAVATTQSLASSSIWDRLPSLRLPTLVTAGTQDQLVPPANDAAIAARIPGAHLARFSGLRHGFFIQRPDEFVPALNPQGGRDGEDRMSSRRDGFPPANPRMPS